MLTLIAESKTMFDEQHLVTQKEFKDHSPVSEEQAALIMHRLGQLSQPDLIAQTGLSPSLAAKLRQSIYEFPNKALGMKAIAAYTGVVFKALDYDSLDAQAKQECQQNVRIISSLYGFLRPDDIIKPYRLDFTTKAAPDAKPLNTFWKSTVTIQLVKTIREQGHREVLDLLPSDASKCIDWKIVKKFCKVWKVDFAEITEGEKIKTPSATKLKTARGKLLRQILCDRINDITALKNIKSDDFFYEGTPVYPDHLRFLC